MRESPNRKRAYLYAGLVILFWSTVASAFKITLRHLDFYQLLWGATTTSFLFLFFLLERKKKLNPLKGFKRKDYLRSALLGFLNPFLYYAILFKAYSLLPAQMAQPLNQTWAIILPLLSVLLLKQRIKIKSILALLVSFFGVLIIATRGEIGELKFTNPLGVFLALISALVWAFYWVYNLRDEREEIVKLFSNFLFGFIFSTIYILFLKGFNQPFSILKNRIGLLGSIYVGLFEMGLTFPLWLRALSLAENTALVSNLIYLIPFLSLVFIRLTVGEQILPSTVIGLMFIILGIFIQRR
ncbi:MAG: DMT family transporter [candidate division WOR-3 bacterium]